MDGGIRLVWGVEKQSDNYASEIGDRRMTTNPTQYQVGPLTMAHVVEYAKLQNLSDMQAFLDDMEAALDRKNDHIRMIAQEAKELP